MVYKASKFVIKIDLNEDEVLLFSTLTTAMIVLRKEIYQGIFDRGDLLLYDNEVRELVDASLLIPEDFDENEYLSKTRTETMKCFNDKHATYYRITPTMNCNARCYYCFEKDAHHENMTLETAMKIVDYIIQHNTQDTLTIQWFGGEPLLSTDIISFISEQLKLNNISFTSKMTTNGYLLDEKTSYKAKHEWYVGVVQITIDAVGEKYNRIKNYKEPKDDPFSLVISNIHHAAKNGINIRVRININPIEIAQAKKTISYLKNEFENYGNVIVYFAPIDSSSDHIPSIANSFEDMHEHPVITLLDFEDNYAGISFSSQEELHEDETSRALEKHYLYPSPMSCGGVCSTSLTIDSLGDFYVCHRLLGQGSECSSGNVQEGFVENKISEYFRGSQLSYLKCDTCNLLPLCQGGCKFKTWKYTGKKNGACTPIKEIADKMLLRTLKELGIDL